MDTSAKSEQAGKRQFRSVQEKLRIVEEANRPGASVAAVALRNGVNANLVFGWRRLHRRGLLERQRDVAPRLLPVKVTMPTLTPSERATTLPAKRERTSPLQVPSCLEIVLAGEVRVRLHGDIRLATLTHILEWASRR
jgi:transposase